MPGSRDRAQPGASATRPDDLQPVLPSESDASGAREGRARSSTHLGNVHSADHRDSGSGRPASPLRTAGSISSGPAAAHMPDISAASARIAHSPFRSIGRTFGADVTFNVIRNQGPGQIVSPVTVGAVLANDSMARNFAASHPVRRVKFFNEDNSRLRYLTEDEYSRLLEAAKTIEASPFLAEKIIWSVHTGLRRGSLFHLRWDQVDFLNRVLRIQRTKSGRPHALPLNATVLTTLQTLFTERLPDCPYVFAHATGRQAGEPVKDVKNGFHTALEVAEIKDFTWHDLRHTFASWLIMKGASLRSVAELLGHRGLRMVMRYAHLSPAYLFAEVGLLDAPVPPPSTERATKGQRASKAVRRRAKVVEFPKGIGSSGWIRTSNPPVNRFMQVVYLVGSSCV